MDGKIYFENTNLKKAAGYINCQTKETKTQETFQAQWMTFHNDKGVNSPRTIIILNVYQSNDRSWR